MKKAVDFEIIVPVRNEAENILDLVRRMDKTFKAANIQYHTIFVDDYSTDKTYEKIKKASKDFPVTYLKKKGKVGKAYSILEGIRMATSDIVGVIDGDLQYPPESLVQMIKMAQTHGVVVANRVKQTTSIVRKIGSKVINFMVGRILNLNLDTQSGMKVFKRSIANFIHEKDVSPWTFDMALLTTAVDLGYSIECVDIEFFERKKGMSKINLVRDATQVVWGALKLKLKGKRIYQIRSGVVNSSVGAGIVHKGRKFVTHTHLDHSQSAYRTFKTSQLLSIFVFLSLFVMGLYINPRSTLITSIGILSLIYFIDLVFSLYLLLKSLHFPPEIVISKEKINKLRDVDLPVYSVLAPLYKEARILPEFLEAVNSLDWPKSKLDVILLLEEDDKTSIEYLEKANLPSHIRALIVPDSLPKTKPKACNFGLNFAKGEFLVVYDAEDKPDTDQLKKAYIAFCELGPNTSCLQSKLNYYNAHDNILTRLFTAEYSLWFDLILPGLQSISTSIPLGGTSNHFRTSDLREINGWDPFNVAEDCDLGVRLFKSGKATAIIDSITLEEANGEVKGWIRQRSRWIKGYLQTYLVHMRTPIQFIQNFGIHAFIFQLVVGMRMTFILINPILWLATISYFILYSYVGPAIEALYPAPVFYMAVTCLVFGNFVYLFNYMIGAAKRGNWSVIKYVYFVPFYWLMTSYAAIIALLQLFFKPHYWEKTIHGLYLSKVNEKRIKSVFISQLIDYSGITKAKSYLKPEYLSGALLIGASMVGNILNFLYNAYLSRKLSLEDFGLISLFGSFVYLSSVLTISIGKTFTHKTAYLYGKYGGVVKDVWFYYRKKLVVYSFYLMGIWLLLSPVLSHVFKFNDIFPLLIFTPVWLMGIVGAIDSSLLMGSMAFGLAAVLLLVDPAIKFAATVYFVETGSTNLVYMAIPVSIFVGFYITFLTAKNLKGSPKRIKISEVNTFPFKFFVTSIISKLSTIVFLSLDLVFAKLFLAPTEAGIYAIVSTVGKIIYFLNSLFGQFIVALASKENAQEDTKSSSFIKIFSLIGLSSIFGVLAFGVFGKYSVPLMMGSKAIAAVPYLALFVIAIAFHSLTSNLVTFHQSKKRFLFPVVESLLSLTTLLGYVFFHDSIWSFVWVMVVSGSISLIGVTLLHFNYSKSETLVKNINDFFGLFQSRLVKGLETSNNKNLRILVFNWRDTKHVWSGGAEVYIHELAKRWVKSGNIVTVFCGNDGKNPQNETIDGVQIVRRGGFFTVYIWAFLYYIFRFRKYFDVIIDSENGVPFFTPLYAGKDKKVFLLIHHVHQEVFRIKLHPPFSWVGKFLEKSVMPVVYRNTEVITVSPSSKNEILNHKLTNKDPFVIYNGVDLNVYKPGEKSVNPLVLYLGRLTPQKSLSVFIRSAKKISEKIPDVDFVIAGDGTDRKRLLKLTKSLGLENKISFAGRVTDEEKVNLYQRAWVFVNPSLIEGWGITTIEANACGTPVVASNVSGLRDAVHNPHSGLLVPYGDVVEFEKAVIKLIKNSAVRNKMSKEAIDWASSFTWSKSANEALTLIKQQN